MSNSLSPAICFRTPSPSRKILHTRIEYASDIEQHYTLGKSLGKGSFGLVVEADRISDGTKWAMKIINKEKAGSANIKLLEHEVKIMKKVNHANIIHLEEVFETADKMYLVMELCSSGDLLGLLEKKVCFSEQAALEIFQQLTDAVVYMHENDIIHRDLKLDNVLLASPTRKNMYNIKLTDFGLSYTRGGSGSDYMMEQVVGTPIYMAPEVITNHSYSQQCDIWSIGIILYTLISGKPPFNAGKEEELYELIKSGELDFSHDKWQDISQAAKQLLEGMLKVDPAHRLTSKEVLHHPWMKGEQNIDGELATNVLEMMKQYRLEQQKIHEGSLPDINSKEELAFPLKTLGIQSDDDYRNNNNLDTKAIETRPTKSASSLQSSPRLSSSSPNVKKSSSKNNIPSYMQATKSSGSYKSQNSRSSRKK